jgi:hypothetical protein
LESEGIAMPPISEAEGQEALEQIAAANREMADRVRAPGWYSWSLSLMMGGLVAMQEAPVTWLLAYEATFFGALAVLVSAYKRRRGVWIPGYRAGRTRWVAVGAAAVYLLIIMGAVYLYREMNIRGACITAGVIVAGVTRLYCRVWEKAYRRDLGIA